MGRVTKYPVGYITGIHGILDEPWNTPWYAMEYHGTVCPMVFHVGDTIGRATGYPTGCSIPNIYRGVHHEVSHGCVPMKALGTVTQWRTLPGETCHGIPHQAFSRKVLFMDTPRRDVTWHASYDSSICGRHHGYIPWGDNHGGP